MTEIRQLFQNKDSKGAIFFSPRWEGKISSDLFLPEYWQNQAETQVLAEGRSTTYKVVSQHSDKPWVLRQYYRGGLLGRLVNRTYFFSSEKAVRSVAEWRLLCNLYELGIAVPKPIAAIYWRSGITYQAAILTEYIANSTTLSNRLVSNEEVSWERIAMAIKAIHKAGCVHGDLNAHNILLHGEHEVTIIDFDKSKILEKAQSVQKKNLFRLKRSILKVTNWPEEKLDNHWQLFMQAYTSA